MVCAQRKRQNQSAEKNLCGFSKLDQMGCGVNQKNRRAQHLYELSTRRGAVLDAAHCRAKQSTTRIYEESGAS